MFIYDVIATSNDVITIVGEYILYT